MIKITNIVGARPNFMKIAPIHRTLLENPSFEPTLIHTGQHYDDKMSKTFFVDLGMPEPDIYLGVGSGSHAAQTSQIMVALERIFIENRPDCVVVVGDVNSTMAAALVASKLCIPVAHIEAGLRSFDRTMPEEINRIVTDAVSDFLFVTEQSGLDNLAREGVPLQKIFFAGNVMIDSLVEHLPKALLMDTMHQLNCQPKQYALMTLHRPSNVDENETFLKILEAMEEIQRHIQIVFPIHPRTRKTCEQFGFKEKMEKMDKLVFSEPLGYLEFLCLMAGARFVLTDSGGIQEETTYLGIPCLTLRHNTERPVTMTVGTNHLVGTDPEMIISTAKRVLNGHLTPHQIPPLWDGRAAERIVKDLADNLHKL